MHLNQTISGVRLERAATDKPPCGPGFDKDLVKKAVATGGRMEVWGTSWDDPGADYCVFKLFDGHNTELDTAELSGY